jgi:hypothetical protein
MVMKGDAMRALLRWRLGIEDYESGESLDSSDDEQRRIVIAQCGRNKPDNLKPL